MKESKNLIVYFSRVIKNSHSFAPSSVRTALQCRF